MLCAPLVWSRQDRLNPTGKILARFADRLISSQVIKVAHRGAWSRAEDHGEMERPWPSFVLRYIRCSQSASPGNAIQRPISLTEESRHEAASSKIVIECCDLLAGLRLSEQEIAKRRDSLSASPENSARAR